MPRIGAAKFHRSRPHLGGPRHRDSGQAEFHGVRVDEPLRHRRRRRSQRDARSRQAVSLFLLQPVPERARTRRAWRSRGCCGPTAIVPEAAWRLWRDGIWDPDCRRRELLPDSRHRTAHARVDLSRGTPLVAPTQAWHDGDDKVDAFWGPSVHWNTAIEQYVMLLNRAKDESYTQEGIYVSYAPRARRSVAVDAAAEDPERRPLVPAGGRLVHGHRDRQARRRVVAVFHERAKSEWMINFSK